MSNPIDLRLLSSSLPLHLATAPLSHCNCNCNCNCNCHCHRTISHHITSRERHQVLPDAFVAKHGHATQGSLHLLGLHDLRRDRHDGWRRGFISSSSSRRAFKGWKKHPDMTIVAFFLRSRAPPRRRREAGSDGHLALAQINLGVSGNDMYIDRPTRCGPCYPPPSGRRLSRAAASKQTSACRKFCKLRAYLLTARRGWRLCPKEGLLWRGLHHHFRTPSSAAHPSPVTRAWAAPLSRRTPTTPAPPL
jgi:hypothetical protein